jgi:hypothetical protein
MTKIVLNSNFSSFGLSTNAKLEYYKRAGYEVVLTEKGMNTNYDVITDVKTGYTLYEDDIYRNDPILVDIVEEWGEEANGDHSKLRIVDIPDDVDWTIEEYDGRETVHERHRSW